MFQAVKQMSRSNNCMLMKWFLEIVLAKGTSFFFFIKKHVILSYLKLKLHSFQARESSRELYRSGGKDCGPWSGVCVSQRVDEDLL